MRACASATAASFYGTGTVLYMFVLRNTGPIWKILIARGCTIRPPTPTTFESIASELRAEVLKNVDDWRCDTPPPATAADTIRILRQ